MQKLTVKIEGTSPILFNNPASMSQKVSVGKKRIPTPAEEAAGKRYLMPGTEVLGFPTYNFVRSMLRASSGSKIGKKSIVPYVAGCVIPGEELASFRTEKYSIDTRRAVVQRSGVMRSRPRLDKWSLTFELLIDSENFPSGFEADSLQPIIAEAGSRVGLGDFRPEKGGPYGRFKIVSFEVKD